MSYKFHFSEEVKGKPQLITTLNTTLRHLSNSWKIYVYLVREIHEMSKTLHIDADTPENR